MKTRNNSLNIFIALAAVVFSITAYNSHGYYHGDEHYQIIEFAGLKLGTHTPDELAWEFNAQIRPTLQPTIAFVLLKSLAFINIRDPYQQAFLLRFLSAILSLICITFFIKQTEFVFKENKIKKLYYFVSYFLWFIPFLSVRFSSEVWAGLFFLVSLGLCQSEKQNSITPYLIGLTFGFSFLFRYQMAIGILVAMLWLLVIKKLELKFMVKVLFSFFIVYCLGVLIDSWYYSEFVLTSWAYFKVNLLEDVASGFGTSPWYFYLQKLVSYPSIFIGVLLVVSLLISIAKYPKSIVLWCVVVFILVHSIIPHKEERFMFPIAFLFPIVITIGIDYLYSFIRNNKYSRSIGYALGVILVVLNTAGLFALAFKSAGLGRMAISKYIHDHYGSQPVNLIYTDWSNPYNPWHSQQTKFYLEEDLVDSRITNLCLYNDSLLAKKRINLLVIRQIDLNDQNCKGVIEAKDFKLVKQSVPVFTQKLNKYYKGLDERNVFLLYALE